jgi:3'-phosphoadenosine 5'-phosphosulfate (PAPS) 3'-phosphatase
MPRHTVRQALKEERRERVAQRAFAREDMAHERASAARLITQSPSHAKMTASQSGKGAARTEFYVRLDRTCEWDVTVGQAILAPAGGLITAVHADPSL